MTVFVGSPRLPKRDSRDAYSTIYTKGPVNRKIIQEIKAPLMERISKDGAPLDDMAYLFALCKASKAMRELPEPMKITTRWRNTDTLIELRDEWFAERVKLWESSLRPFINFAIIIYDYDPYYQQRIDALYDWWHHEPWDSLDYSGRLDILLRLRDRFFAMEQQEWVRVRVFNILWGAAISAYKLPLFRREIDWVLDRWKRKPWEPREPGRPRPPTWREFEMNKI